MLPGLKTYQHPKTKDLKAYIDKINPNKRYLNSIFILLACLFCLFSTLYILDQRYGSPMLYQLLKQV